MVPVPDALVQWRVVYVALLAAFVGLALAPAALDRVGRVRRLDPVERRRLAAGAVDPTGVRVLEPDADSDGAGPAVAFAAGLLPGVGRVVVSRPLLGALPDEELAAVVAHERGHLRRGHVLLRLGGPAAFVLAWTTVAAAGVPGGFGAGLALVGPVALASFALSRWTEFDADRFAARRGLGPALARALERLEGGGSPVGGAEDAGGKGPRGRRARRTAVATLLARHPPIEARVTRLRADDGRAADDRDARLRDAADARVVDAFAADPRSVDAEDADDIANVPDPDDATATEGNAR